MDSAIVSEHPLGIESKHNEERVADNEISCSTNQNIKPSSTNCPRSGQNNCAVVLPDSATYQEMSSINIEKEGTRNSEATIGRFFLQAWKLHKWISMQPEFGKNRTNVVSGVAYVLFFIIACVPVHDILTYANAYTDVETKYPGSSPVLVPDIIICPGNNRCPYCSEQIKNYEFTHQVWWNSEIVRLLNISSEQLDFVAGLARRQSFGEKTEFPNELNEHDQFRIIWKKVVTAYIARYPNQLQDMMLVNSSFNMSSIMNLLVEHEQSKTRIIVNTQVKEGGKLQKRYMPVKFTWLEKAYCLLFANTEGLVINYRWSYLRITYPVNSRYWLGNLTSELILYNKMFTTPIFSVRQSRQIEFVLVRDHTSKSPVESKCQYALSEYFKTCKIKEPMQDYSIHLIHATVNDRRSIKYLVEATVSTMSIEFNRPMWYISRHKVYSSLAVMEITMGIFCLFLGISAYQFFSVFRILLGKRWKIFQGYISQALIVVLMLISTMYILIVNLSSLFSPSINQKISLGAELPMPSFRVDLNFGLNFTKVIDLNISLALLHYLHVGSIMAGLGESDIGLHQLFSFDRMQFLKEINKTKKCSNEIDKLHNQHKILSKILGVHPMAPAFKLLEKLYIDKCQLIVGCEFNGIYDKDCCELFDLVFDKHGTRQIGPFYLMRHNYQKHIRFVNSRTPDMQINLNQAVFTESAPAFRNFLQRNINHYTITRQNLELRIERSVEILMPYRIVEIGMVTHKYMFSTAGKVDHLAQGSHAEILLNYESEPHQKSQSASCVNQTVCFGNKKNYLKYLGMNSKNVHVYNHCGCFVCYNGMNILMKEYGECCSPEIAFNCIADPLLFVKNANKSSCKKSDVVCEFDGQSEAHCSAAKRNSFLGHPYGTFFQPFKRYDKRNERYFFKYPGEFSKSSLDDIRMALIDFGCGNVTQGLPEICNDIKPQYQLTGTAYTLPQVDNITNVQVRVNRASILNSYVSSRTDRRFSVLEVIGIFLTGVGLFLGVDILCLIESFLNLIAKNKKERVFQQNLVNAALPIHAHLLRMFVNLSTRNNWENNQSDQKMAKDARQNNDDYMRKSSEAHLHRHNHKVEFGAKDISESYEEISALKSGIFFMATVGIFLSGIGVCTYVGTSDFLAVNEYNLEVVKEDQPQKYPSYAVCRSASHSKKHTGRVSYDLLAEALNKSHCWVEMEMKPCKPLFELYLDTGRHHCLVTNESSASFKVRKLLLQHNEFTFGILTPSSLVKSLGLYVWYGSLHNALRGMVPPSRWINRILVTSYHKVSNISCISKVMNDNLCPKCNDTKLRTSCCFSYLNKTHSYKTYIEDKTQCEEAFFKQIENKNSIVAFQKAAVESSEILSGLVEEKSCKHIPCSGYFWGVRRSVPYVFIFREIPRHSPGAKFALVSGYIDLFLGLSLVAFGGAAILKIWKKFKSAFEGRQ